MGQKDIDKELQLFRERLNEYFSGYSNTAISEEANINKQSVANLLSGPQAPNIRSLMKLFLTYEELDLEYLFRGIPGQYTKVAEDQPVYNRPSGRLKECQDTLKHLKSIIYHQNQILAMNSESDE